MVEEIWQAETDPRKRTEGIANFPIEEDQEIIDVDGHDAIVAWAPFPGSQQQFMDCPFFECLYEGNRGPGKTDALLMDYFQHVGKGFGPAWRGILFRRQFKELADVITKTKRWFRQICPAAVFLEGNSQLKWRFPDGEELLFRTIKREDDYWEYHGHEYPWVGWEELCSWPDLSLYYKMKSVCRSSQAGMPRKYRSTANPYGPGHNAVKAYFIDPAPSGTPIINDEGEIRIRITGRLHENKFLMKNDPNYMKRLLSAANAQGNLRKAWAEGDWNIVAGGLIDDIWDSDEHVIPPFTIPAHWRVDRSFDWGSSRPFSVGWHAVSDGSTLKFKDGQRITYPKGTLFRIAEWYGWNGVPNTGLRMIDSEIARGIKKREDEMIGAGYIKGRIYPGPADSQIFDEKNGDSPIDTFERNKVYFDESDKSQGSRIRGLQVFRRRLKAALEFPMQEPGYFVFSNCRQFIRTVPTLPRDPKNFDDADTEAEDHVWDEVRYRVLASAGRAGSKEVDGDY